MKTLESWDTKTFVRANCRKRQTIQTENGSMHLQGLMLHRLLIEIFVASCLCKCYMIQRELERELLYK